ncbi:MAG: DinB family protein [Heyndrickxia sp.]
MKGVILTETLFQYNWLVRDEWFEWCKSIPEEELLKPRTGGVGSILKTLFHIVDVEYSWIRHIQGKSEFEEPFEHYNSLEKVIELSHQFHHEVETYLQTITHEIEETIIPTERGDGSIQDFTVGEILRHSIVHEIHHIGQLSVWARELDRAPISANLIGRGLASKSQ